MVRSILAGPIILGVLAACSSAEPPRQAAATNGESNSSTVSIDASTLGSFCNGGCSPDGACAVEDSHCPSGLCGFDARYGYDDRWVGCTADCSSGTCPVGYECVDVEGKAKRACMKLPDAKLTMDVSANTVIKSADGRYLTSPLRNLHLETNIPSEGDAQRCGRVEILSETETETHLAATLCGVASSTGNPKRVFEIEFSVPKTVSTTEGSILVYNGPPGSYARDQDGDDACNPKVNVTEVSARGTRKGSVHGAFAYPTCSTTYLPFSGTFEIQTASLATSRKAGSKR